MQFLESLVYTVKNHWPATTNLAYSSFFPFKIYYVKITRTYRNTMNMILFKLGGLCHDRLPYFCIIAFPTVIFFNLYFEIVTLNILLI